mmetsp:Transcript_26813/g.43163  ORF Transcript_26813/g.43163 Transcript_26813/m.43163 type:complete len:145 (+) Transcript_26813:15-449(+)
MKLTLAIFSVQATAVLSTMLTFKLTNNNPKDVSFKCSTPHASFLRFDHEQPATLCLKDTTSNTIQMKPDSTTLSFQLLGWNATAGYSQPVAFLGAGRHPRDTSLTATLTDRGGNALQYRFGFKPNHDYTIELQINPTFNMVMIV